MNKREQPTLLPNAPTSEARRDQPTIFQIRVEGQLNSQWSEWFGGLTITLKENGDTLLTGPIVDQAALYGLLKKVRDLGMNLVSVNRVKSTPASAVNKL